MARVLIRICVVTFLFMLCSSLMAQKMLQVHKSNGETVSFMVDEVDSLTIMEKELPSFEEPLVRFVMPNIYAVPLLANACVAPGEFCTITCQNGMYYFSTPYNSSIISSNAMQTHLSNVLGLCGLIIGTPNFSFNGTSVVCYDLACPNCHSQSRIASLTLMAGGFVTCSVCGRCYDLNSNGVVSSGEAGRSLYRYRVALSGQMLMVTNQGDSTDIMEDPTYDLDLPELPADNEAPLGTLLSDLISQDTNCSLFYEAMVMTGLDSLLDVPFLDETWDASLFLTPEGAYSNNALGQNCCIPTERRHGHTLFVCTDSVLDSEYKIRNVEDLTDYAQTVYGGERNVALKNLLSYCILERKTSFSRLTAISNIDVNVANPTSWYESMLPHSLVKLSRTDDRLFLNKSIELTLPKCHNSCEYGSYYYTNAFPSYSGSDFASERIRMDFYTLFPELENVAMRTMSGKTTAAGTVSEEAGSKSYIIPPSYIESASMNQEGYIIYQNTQSTAPYYEGDALWLGGRYDFSFKLPSVPADGVYEVRLGYTAQANAGICQTYLNNVPCGIPTNMKPMDANTSGWQPLSDLISDDEALEEATRRIRNNGFMNAPYSSVYYDTEDKNFRRMCDNPNCLRNIIVRKTFKAGTDYTLRLKSVLSNDAPICLDYIELVPQTVYGNKDSRENIY